MKLGDLGATPSPPEHALIAETLIAAVKQAPTSGMAVALGSPLAIKAHCAQWVVNDDYGTHDGCTLTACLNPLHPGPCKGWKHNLFKSAPEAFHALEKAKADQANSKRLAKIKALKDAGKPIPKSLLVPIQPKSHPDAGKTAKAATGEAHAAGQVVTKEAGITPSAAPSTNLPGKVTLGQATKALPKPAQPVEKGPKGKKPTLASKGIAFVIAQEKVTDQYKLDKAAKITPQEWADLSAADESTIGAELFKIANGDGFDVQKKKAVAILHGLGVDTITTPSGKVHQKVEVKHPGLAKPTTPGTGAKTYPAPGKTEPPKKFVSTLEPAPSTAKKPAKPAKHVQYAIDMSEGAAPGASWAKHQLFAYQQLKAEEFNALPLDTQKKIVSDLQKGHGKFLDPKKKIATEELLAKFGHPLTGSKAQPAKQGPAAPKPDKVVFDKHLYKMDVTEAEAEQAVADAPLHSVKAVAYGAAGIPPEESPESSTIAAHALNHANETVKAIVKGVDHKVLAEPAVVDAMKKYVNAHYDEEHARSLIDAKKFAQNKVSSALNFNTWLSPIQKASLKRYQKHLDTIEVPEDVDHLSTLRTLRLVKLKHAIHDAQQTKSDHEPQANLTLAEKQQVHDNAIKSAVSKVQGVDGDVLLHPEVKSAYSNYLNHAEAAHTASTMLSKVNAYDDADSDAHQYWKGVAMKEAEAALKAALDLKAAIAKHSPPPPAMKAPSVEAPVPNTLTDFDKTNIPAIYESAWSKHAIAAVAYGTKDNYPLKQKLLTHESYGKFQGEYAALRQLAGKVALAHAEANAAQSNVPLDPETGSLLPGPQLTAFKKATFVVNQLESEFDQLHGQAQGTLDKIRTDVGLKKRVLPKLDTPAVKTAAAEAGYYKSGQYNGPNYNQQAKQKNYLLAKVGSKLAVAHKSAAEKKAEKGAPNPPTKSAAKLGSPTAKGEPVKVDMGNLSETAHVPASLKKQITSDFKEMPKGKYLADPTSDVFDNLVTLAGAHGKDVQGGLSVDQVIKVIDETHSKNLGVANSGMLHKKVSEWLGTPEGKAYAESHSTPDPKLVKKLKGELVLPQGVTLEPGEKVQKLAGPGAFDDSLDKDAFKPLTPAAINESQKAYMSSQGIKWTPEQKSAIKHYTGSGSAAINPYLRGAASGNQNTKQQAIEIQAAMVPLQHHTLLKRGTGYDALPDGFQSAEGAAKLVGKTFQEDGFSSTTIAGASGHFSGQPVQLIIEAPTGTPAAWVNQISHFKDTENELLLAAGTKFKVISVEKKGHQTFMRVRVVGGK